MNPLKYVSDSLRNLVTGVGTSRDPLKANRYEFCELDYHQLTSAYRSNWIARRVVDAIPEDATREWRSWQAEQDVIEVIESEEKKHDLQRKTKHAMTRARLYGGAVMILGVDGSGNADEELELDKLSEGCLRFVAVFNRHEMAAGQRIFDVQSPWFLRPSYYTIATPTTNLNDPALVDSGMVQIHPSRVIEFVGNELPDWRLATMGAVWGDSVLQTLDETLKGFGMSMNGIATLVNDAKIDVIKIPNLAGHLKTDATTNKLFERFAYAAMGKSNLSALLIDAAEEWDRTTTSFAGLPDIMQQFMTLVSGGAGIPVSRLMGSSPGKGLNTTGGGESDLRNYYDDCASKQKTVYSPAMTPLDNVIQISATGELDENIYYDWNPLYQPDPKQLADIAFSKAQATNLDVQMNLINEDALRDARVNQLIEDGTYPGLDEAIDEHGSEPAEPVEPTPEDMQAHIGMMQKSASQLKQIGSYAAQDARRMIVANSHYCLTWDEERGAHRVEHVTDATPRTLYVRRNVLNANAIIKWAKANGFETTVPADQMHVTIIYSRMPMDWMKISSDWSSPGNDNTGKITIPPGGVRLLEQMGKAVALLFTDSNLQWRHQMMKDAGAVTDFQDYQPHISLTFQPGNAEFWRKIEPYRGPIVLGPEIFEEVKDGASWRDTFQEDGQ